MNMVEIYAVCGEWKEKEDLKWLFVIDSTKGASISDMDENISYKELKDAVAEDFLLAETNFSLSYALPTIEDLFVSSPPIYIRNDRQVKGFFKKIKAGSIIRLCITVDHEIIGNSIQRQIQTYRIVDENSFANESTTADYVQENDNLSRPSFQHDKRYNYSHLQIQPYSVVDDSSYVNSTSTDDYVQANDNLSHSSFQNDKSSKKSPLRTKQPVNDNFSHSSFQHDKSRKQPDVTQSFCTDMSDVSSVSTRISYLARFAEDIVLNKKFSSKHDLLTNMKNLAIKGKFEFKTVYSDTIKVKLICVDNRCGWKMRATREIGSNSFIVQEYVHGHTCDTTFRKSNHRQAGYKVVGKMYCSNFGEKKEGLNPKQIMELLRNDHGIHINYKKAWRSKVFAEDLIRGTPEDSYRNIGGWLYVNKMKNPGSEAFLELDSDGKFLYSYFAFGQSLRGFKLMRRVIAIDGTFLKSKYRGTLLAATAQDGDYHLYPLAYAIVDAEDGKSWNWFLRCLSASIPDAADLAFISDRAHSIAKALSEVYPLSYHGICKVHLINNIKARFGKRGMLSTVESASEAYTVFEFQELFQQIVNYNPKLAKYLEDSDFTKWTRCHAPLNRYNMMTTNIAESLNALLKTDRELPIVSLYETIRLTLTTWFYDRRIKAAAHDKLVTPTVVDKMVERFDAAMSMSVYPVNESEFEVKDGIRKYVVLLNEKTCSCRAFDLDRIPCVHAIAAAKFLKLDEYKYVDVFHLTDIWGKAYAESVHPAGDITTWNVPEYVTRFLSPPPSTRLSSGRPVTKRYRSVGEFGQPGSKKQSHMCSRCGTQGHNKSTCTTAI